MKGGQLILMDLLFYFLHNLQSASLIIVKFIVKKIMFI